MLSPIFLTLHNLVVSAEEVAEMLVDTEYATSEEVDALINSLVALEEINMTMAPPLEKTIFAPEWEIEEDEEEELDD